MTSIELWCLKQILHGQLKQGTNHTENLAGVYMLVRDEIEHTFGEDNSPTLNAYCKENFEKSQRMTAIKEQTKFNWDKASIICTLNGYKWHLGPEAEGELTWEDAVAWCKLNGGELPPREILFQAYMNEDTKKEFNNESYYWSSTKFSEGGTWIQDFFHGYQIGGVNSKINAVRAVREIKLGDTV